MRYLRQSTEITLRIGPFLDATDGKTEETGLAGNGTEIAKAGGAFGAGPVLGEHDADGYYPVTLTTTHTNTLGAMRLKSHDAAHLPVWEDFEVMLQDQWDGLYASGGMPPVNAVEINSSATAAANLADSCEVIAKDTVDDAAFTPTTTEFEVATITTAAADHWKGRVIVFKTGDLAKQATIIEAYSLVGGKGHFTVTALTSAPADGDVFVIL